MFSFAETFQLLPDSHIVLIKRWRNSHTCKTKFFFSFSIMKKTSEEKKNKVFHLQSLMFDVCCKRNALGKCPNLKRKYLLLRALNHSAFDKKANIKSGQLSALLKRLFKRIGGKKVMKMLFCYEPSIQAKSRRLSSLERKPSLCSRPKKELITRTPVVKHLVNISSYLTTLLLHYFYHILCKGTMKVREYQFSPMLLAFGDFP